MGKHRARIWTMDSTLGRTLSVLFHKTSKEAEGVGNGDRECRGHDGGHEDCPMEARTVEVVPPSTTGPNRTATQV